MTLWQAFALAFVQGTTELFPVSSLGHAVLMPWLLGWRIDQHATSFLPFLVMLHVGTALALLCYFWRTWWALIRAVLGVGENAEVRRSRHLAFLVVVATIPAVLVGAVLEHTLRRFFSSPVFASGFLIANGCLLLLGERLQAARRSGGAEPIKEMTIADALLIGCWQCLALLPGLSRSGATMVGGLLRGLDHEVSACFSFLIALPIIVAASVREVPRLVTVGHDQGVLEISLMAAVVSGFLALASTAFLMRYFKVGGENSLRPFAIYCFCLGGFAVVVAALGVSRP